MKKRNVQRTVSESVVVGSQEGFVEKPAHEHHAHAPLCPVPALISEMTTVGKSVPLRIAILYMKGVAREETLAEMRKNA